jgi:hypothetical protein
MLSPQFAAIAPIYNSMAAFCVLYANHHGLEAIAQMQYKSQLLAGNSTKKRKKVFLSLANSVSLNRLLYYLELSPQVVVTYHFISFESNHGCRSN